MRTRRGVIAIGRDIDVDEWQHDVDSGERPRHYAIDLARRADLEVIASASERPRLLDRLGGFFVGRASSWALARDIVRRTNPSELVFATDETIGIPYLLAGRHRRQRAQALAMFVMAPHRPRIRLWLWLLGRINLLPSLLIVNAAENERRLRTVLRTDASRVWSVPVVVDDHFFRPGGFSTSRNRPLIASAGLEQRDYRRLAEAVDGLDADVVVCAMSPDRANSATSMPPQVPANMRFEPLSMRELRDLYVDSDLFVLSTRPNSLAAGLTAVMEALACGTDVIVSVGAADLADLGEDGFVTAVPDTAASSLRSAIERSIAESPDRSGLPRVRLTADAFVDQLIDRFRESGLLGRNVIAPREALEVSIVVPVGRVEASLRTQLTALLSQDTHVDYEIVISHNTPTPEDRQRLTDLLAELNDPRILVVEAPLRRGAAHTRNAGAAVARGRLLMFCDADDRVHDGWIEALRVALDDSDAVTGAIHEIAPPGQESWRPPATPGGLPEFLGRPYVLSGNLGIRSHAFRAVGGFDERLTRCEDIALGWTLAEHGYDLGFASEAVLDYHHRAGLIPMLRQHYFYGVGMSEVLRRYPNEQGAADGRGLGLLRANRQQHSRTAVSVIRRAAIGLGRVRGLASRGVA